MKSFSQDSQVPAGIQNSAPPEYKSRPQSNLSGGTGMARNKYEFHDTKHVKKFLFLSAIHNAKIPAN